MEWIYFLVGFIVGMLVAVGGGSLGRERHVLTWLKQNVDGLHSGESVIVSLVLERTETDTTASIENVEDEDETWRNN